MGKKPKILVVGSCAMDLIVSTRKFPESGETVIGSVFSTAPGGKGANQAVQAALLGADVTFVGKVGDDDFGKSVIASFERAGVRTGSIGVDKAASTGIANILLEVGETETRNRIIVVRGANGTITPADIAFLKDGIADFDFVMLQLEIPMEINELVAQYAAAKGVPVALNSAPSAPLSEELLSRLSWLTPNEHEAADLTGVRIGKNGADVNRDDVAAAVAALRAKGVKNVIITLGSAGAAVAGDFGISYSPCVPGVTVVDPTAAGDSFVAAFAVASCCGLSPEKSLLFSNHVASITVSRMGAQPSLPTLDEARNFMRAHGVSDSEFVMLDALR